MSEKTLCIVRHALPEGYNPLKKDHQRALTDIGLKQANTLGEVLKYNGFKPALVRTSDAARALQTTQIISEKLGISFDLQPEIYGVAPRGLLGIIEGLDDRNKSAMFVGHNPTFSEFVQLLTLNPIVLTQAQCVILKADCDSWMESGSTSWRVVKNIKPSA